MDGLPGPTRLAVWDFEGRASASVMRLAGGVAGFRASRHSKPNMGLGLTTALMMQMMDRGCLGTALLPQEKPCACCGGPFGRPEFTRDGRGALRQPQCGDGRSFARECVRRSRLEGPVREVLPQYLAVLEPEPEPLDSPPFRKAHVLAIGVDAVTWGQRKAALKDSGTARPVVKKLLSDPDEQLSYCIKFVDYHRPGRKRVPLKPDRLVELAAWRSRYRFEDFLFVYGLPRRGGRIDVDESALLRPFAYCAHLDLLRWSRADPGLCSPARRPPLDERSLNSRAKIQVAIAQARAELRAGPPQELRRDIEDELERLVD
jgi:hypothetical protein